VEELKGNEFEIIAINYLDSYIVRVILKLSKLVSKLQTYK
jgi:hypothetical protein